MRRHISRDKTRYHFEVYEQRCREKNIRVHSTALPKIDKEREEARLSASTGGPLDSFFSVSQWTKEDFSEHLENFIAEANVVRPFYLHPLARH